MLDATLGVNRERLEHAEDHAHCIQMYELTATITMFVLTGLLANITARKFYKAIGYACPSEKSIARD